MVAFVSWRIARSVSAWARPRPSANASAMFANTTVSHSQNEITNVYQAGSLPPSALPPNTWINHVTVVIAAPISTTNITGLRIWTRGSSLITLSSRARLTISGLNSEIARRSEGVLPGAVSTDISGLRQAVEGEVELEHVHTGFTGEAETAPVGVLRY